MATVLELFPEQLPEKPESFRVSRECGRVAGSDGGCKAPTSTDWQEGAIDHQGGGFLASSLKSSPSSRRQHAHRLTARSPQNGGICLINSNTGKDGFSLCTASVPLLLTSPLR